MDGDYIPLQLFLSEAAGDNKLCVEIIYVIFIEKMQTLACNVISSEITAVKYDENRWFEQ